jgi:hypothetical protein
MKADILQQLRNRLTTRAKRCRMGVLRVTDKWTNSRLYRVTLSRLPLTVRAAVCYKDGASGIF